MGILWAHTGTMGCIELSPYCQLAQQYHWQHIMQIGFFDVHVCTSISIGQ